MKGKVTSKIKTCVVILLAATPLVSTDILRGGTASEFRAVDPNRIPEILTMISEQVRSNYERIKTWQGETEFTIYTIYEGDRAERIFNTRTDGKGETPNTVVWHIEGRRKFAVDLEKDFLYANVSRENPPRYMDFETGRDLGTKSAPSQKISIVTPEYYINWGPHTMRDGAITSRKFVKKVRQKGSTCANLSPPVSDPRECFVVGQPIWETFPRLLQYMELHGEVSVDGYALKVEECTDGNLTKYRIQIPGKVSPTDYLFMTMFFSGNKGFNITSVEETMSDGKLLHKRTWDYDLVNGVYVPSRTTEQIFERKNGELSYEAKYTFKNAKTNHPISQETFTYKNLGLKNGDKFIDKITNKEYTYQDGDLISASEEK